MKGNGWMDGWMDRQTNRQKSRQTSIYLESGHIMGIRTKRLEPVASRPPPHLAEAWAWAWMDGPWAGLASAARLLASLAGRHDTGPEVEVRGLIGGRAGWRDSRDNGGGRIQLFCGAHSGKVHAVLPSRPLPDRRLAAPSQQMGQARATTPIEGKAPLLPH